MSEQTEEPTQPELPATPDEQPEEPTPDEQPDEPTPDKDVTPNEEEREEEQPAPPAPAPSVEAQKREQDKARKQLDAENARHHKRVHEIMGEDAQYLVDCPLCGDPTTGFLMVQEEGVLSPEHLANLKQLLGIGLPTSYKHHPSIDTCPTCEGEGWCATGSKVQNFEAIQCPQCQGKGWAGTGPTPLYDGNGQSVGVQAHDVGTHDLAAPHPLPADINDDPRVAALRAEGYIVAAPVSLPS